MITAYYFLLLLIAAIFFIVWLTAYKKMNAFVALLIAALAVAFLSGLPLDNIANTLKKGFGDTMNKIGLLIILGTILGIILEKTGATASMAACILRKVKEEHAPAAIAITGFIIGLPIFCDSGFVVLSGLNHSLVQKTNSKMPVMAAALATALYAVHCLVPPHPGITAAVSTVGGNIGIVMLWGIALAVPAAIVGYTISVARGNRVKHIYINAETSPMQVQALPPAALSFIPVVLPIILIAARSVAQLFAWPQTGKQSSAMQVLTFAGEPVIALVAGIVASLLLINKTHKKELSLWLTEGVEKAGNILSIIAAGGMFGEVLQATGIGKNAGELLSGLSLGIFFPFSITAILKTAQGSTTVAIITASSLVAPMLHNLGLATSTGTTLAILSMGAGSMVVSHANDAYFWVVSRFSNLQMATTLKVYTTATLMMGIMVQLLVWILYKLLL